MISEKNGSVITENHVWNPFTNMKQANASLISIVEGNGVYITDDRGKKYINGFAGLSLVCGLGNTEILQAVEEQMKKLSYCSLFRMMHEPAANLADRLIEITPKNIQKVIFTNSGSEAVECAIKIVRQFFRINREDKYHIVSLERSYHGTYFGSFSLSGIYINKEHEVYQPLLPGISHIPSPYCYRCPFDLEYPECNVKCARTLEEKLLELGGKLAAIIIEPVSGAGGTIIPPNEYFNVIKEICNKHKILLIVDESATGFGRIGSMFAIDHWGLEPDIFILSKGINGGYLPLGAVMVTNRIYERFLEGDGHVLTHGTSQSGNPACCAASLATLNIIERDKLCEKSKVLGSKLLLLFKELESKYEFVGEVRGIGLMFAIELVENKASKRPLSAKITYKIFLMLQEYGLITHAKENRISFFPPLIISEVEIKEVFKIIDYTFSKFSEEYK